MANGDDTAPPASLPLPLARGVVQSLPFTGQFNQRPPSQEQLTGGRPQDYISALNRAAIMGRNPRDLGTGSPEGAGYPAGITPDTPYFPQTGQLGGIYHNLVTGLGQYGPPGIANPMIQAGLNMQMITPAYMAGAREMVGLRLQQMQLKSAEALNNWQSQMHDYAQAYHMYGPTYDDNGNLKDPGNTTKLMQMIEAKAMEHQDKWLQNAAHTGDLKAVEQYLHWLDGQGTDLKAAHEKLQIELDKQKLAKGARESSDEKSTRSVWQDRPGEPNAAPVPTGPIKPEDVPPVPPDLKPEASDPTFIPNNSVDDQPVPGGRPASAPAPAPAQEGAATPQSSLAQRWAAPPTQARTPQTQLAMAQAAQQPPQRPQPVQAGFDLRGLGNMVMGASPQEMAQAQTSTDEPPPPAVTTPAGRLYSNRGTDPFPRASFQQRFDPAIAEPLKPVTPKAKWNWSPKESDVIKTAREAPDPTTGRYWSASAINSLGQRLFNGTLRPGEFNTMPKVLRSFAQARRQEIEREMDGIAADPNIKGDDVYKAIRMVNPEFADSLKQFVSGNFQVPYSAWNNRPYLTRVVNLGYKADWTFNQSTFAVRAAARKEMAIGQDARNITSASTLYWHANRMLHDLQIVKKYHPDIFATKFGLTRSPLDTGNLWSNPPELREALARIKVDAETVSNEYQRAITNAKPTVSGRDMDMHNLNFGQEGYGLGQTIDSVIEAVQARKEFARDRMTRIAERYLAIMGNAGGTRPLDEMGKLIMDYAGGPAAVRGVAEANKGIRPDEIPDPMPTRESVGAAIELLRQIRDPAMDQIERIERK